MMGFGRRIGPGGAEAMIQCTDCEFFKRNEDGEISFRCDPFSTIKEPQCLAKWQLIKINQMVAAYHATLEYYRKLAPMQEKMFKVMEREIDDMNEAERWKIADDEEEELDSNDDWRPDSSDSSHF
jgi:hypothetical protein